MAPPGTARLWTLERAGLVLVGVLILAFGLLTEVRSCFQKTRKTDFEVYVRAAWAVRTGSDLYAVTCSNGYHYTYPPAFAIVMAPLADAPQGAPRIGLIPFAVSVAVWTLLNFVLVGRMAHVLASLALPDESRGSRRWWYARTVPVYVALGGIGYSIGFGQVNVVLAALAVETLRASFSGRRLQSGLWLAAAITIKVFPAYLILYPLARRDGRALLGTVIGLLVGLGVIPMAALGVDRTTAAYRGYLNDVLLPGALGTQGSKSLRELIDLPANDSQSFLAVIHGNLHPDRATQPAAASNDTRLAHNLIAAGLTLATLLLALRRDLSKPADATVYLGLLMLLMLHITPMSHMHYYAFGYVLAAGLWLKGMAGRPDRVFPGWRVALPLTVWAIGTMLPLFPGADFELLRYRGLGLVASMLLWTAAMVTMVRREAAVADDGPVILPFRRPAIRKAA